MLKYICSVAESCTTLQSHWLQHARIPCPSPSLWACSNSCQLSGWCHPIISSSVVPCSSCLQFSQHQGLLQWVSSSHQVARLLELKLQHQSLQWIFRIDLLYNWPVWSPCRQGTLKGLLQHHNSKASILQCSAFFAGASVKRYPMSKVREAQVRQ